MRTLVLNAGYEPLAVVSFKRAIVLVMNEKAVVVEHVDGEPVWAARGVVRPPRGHPADALRARSGRPAHPGDPTRRAAPRCAPLRILRQGGLDDRPHPAALARRRGLVGEPRRLLPALQQREGRSHAAGDVVGAADHPAAAPGRAVDGAGHRPHRPVLGAVPRPRGVEPAHSSPSTRSQRSRSSSRRAASARPISAIRRCSFSMCAVKAASISSRPAGVSAMMRWRASAELGPALDQTLRDEPVDPLGQAAGRDHGVVGEVAGGARVGRTRAAEGREHVEVALVQAVAAVHRDQFLGQQRGDAVQSADHSLREGSSSGRSRRHSAWIRATRSGEASMTRYYLAGKIKCLPWKINRLASVDARHRDRPDRVGKQLRRHAPAAAGGRRRCGAGCCARCRPG